MNAIALDTETTGLDDPQPIEIAWIRLSDPVSLDRVEDYHERFKPSKPIQLGALATHHIMEEDLANCRPSTEFKMPQKVGYIVGHNIDFDWEVIGRPDVKRIDTVCLCRRLWPSADSHSLGAMLYLLERNKAREYLRSAHSAEMDVTLCVLVLTHIVKKLGHPKSWEELWQYSETARVPEIMPFGKHKGVRIADVPADYKRWLLGQKDVDPYLIKALQGK